jgi:phage tail sheath protein FI
MILHCATLGDRVALLDAFPPNSSENAQDQIKRQIQMLDLGGTGAVNAALYHPRIRTLTSSDKSVPPCGHIAGIIARTDAAVGVFKAPANTEIQGAIDLAVDLGTDALGKLNDAGVNCIRAFPARGIRVWGARTLSPDPAWRFLNVRRLVLTTLRWIDANMTWAPFEPNVPALWGRIERELSAYLRTVWNAGGLAGAAESDAFFVRCNAETNPPDRREAGEVNTEIGLAPSVPAEFIVVSVQHRAGTTELL